MNDQLEYLYKYRAIDQINIDRSKRIFTHNEVYFSRYDQFNDPFDCKFGYSFSASDGEAKKYITEGLKRNYPRWNRLRRQHGIAECLRKFKAKDPVFMRNLEHGTADTLSKVGIYSFSRVPDDILMWSHYANSHQGFCLKFFDDPQDKFIVRAQPISYSDEYPIVNPVKDDGFTRLEKSLLTKAAHWEYERNGGSLIMSTDPALSNFLRIY